MKLRTKFILIISLLHLIALVLSFYIFNENKLLFLASEVLLLISVIFSLQLYNQMLKPLKTIVDGIEAIKSKDFNIKFLQTGSYEMDQLINVYNEMMDHLKTERTRQEQQHFFLEKMIHTSPTGILILDFDNNVQQVNPKAAALLGADADEILHQRIESLEKPLLKEISALQSGESKTISADGIHTYKIQRSHFIDRGFARSFVMIEELTAEILAAEKKAYGKVIRMMAHEVNNTIGPVNSIIDSALKTPDLWTEKHQPVEHALQVAHSRNQNLNIFMRNFADVVRLPSPNKSDIDLNELLKRILILFETKVKIAKIQFQQDLPSSRFLIHADVQQMEQVLINIIKNAAESIGSDGTISIHADPVNNKLSIVDSGGGITNEHAEHVFSPFFSTKKDGQGVGLTLVKEILLNHGFTFSLTNAKEGGAEFEIVF